ncbi:MAG: hypothetical protein ABW195_14150 [Ilumatobacteraceae bacterium]
MVLWFVATAIVSVWFVFRDPRFDYRLLIVGSVLPLADGVTGGASVLHTLVACLLLVAVVMLTTIGRRSTRKLLLGLPLGMLLHLVFDGVWNDTDLFWWPLGGWGFDDVALPEVARGWLDVGFEVVGAAVLVWVWRASHLSDPVARRRFVHDGRLFTGTA